MFQRIHLYDNDNVTYSETSSFPFQEAYEGVPKVEAIDILLRSLGCNVNIYKHEQRVTSKFKANGFIIDCRDDKSEKITSNMRVSLDGNALYIDCRKIYSKIVDWDEYTLERNPVYIDLAASLVTTFIAQGLYSQLNYVMYDLKRLFDDYIQITQDDINGINSDKGSSSKNNK